MSEVLKPYTEFDSHDLASAFYGAVNANQGLLIERNILGPIARYGQDLDHGTEKVEKGKREHAAGQLGHYAVISSSGNVVGAASIYPDLPLYRQRLPFPAGIARRIPFIGTNFPHANPNIHAWTNGEETELLALAYRELANIANQPRFETPIVGKPTTKEPFNVTWTLEPLSAPQEIHEAIVASSGLQEVKTARFDDGEDGRKIPPRGTLYAMIRSEWSSSRGKLKELRNGRHSFMACLSIGDDDVMSLNPRG